MSFVLGTPQIFRSLLRVTVVGLLALGVACDGCAGCGEEPPVPDAGAPPAPDVRPTEDEPEDNTLAVATELAESEAEKLAVRSIDSASAVAGAIEAENASKPAPPKPKIKDEPETGTLQKAQLNKVFNMHADAMKSCYERSLKRSPGLAGKVRLEVVIGSNGSVRSANARGLSLKDDNVTSCMERQAATMKFPEPEGGAVRVNKSFTFTPDF